MSTFAANYNEMMLRHIFYIPFKTCGDGKTTPELSRPQEEGTAVTAALR